MLVRCLWRAKNRRHVCHGVAGAVRTTRREIRSRVHTAAQERGEGICHHLALVSEREEYRVLGVQVEGEKRLPI